MLTFALRVALWRVRRVWATNEARPVEHHGDQLELQLYPDEPWGGRSPRVLTRGWIGLFSKRERGGTSAFLDPEQLVLWPPNPGTRDKKRRRISAGAPSLLPLPLKPKASRSGFHKGGYHGETT